MSVVCTEYDNKIDFVHYTNGFKFSVYSDVYVVTIFSSLIFSLL